MRAICATCFVSRPNGCISLNARPTRSSCRWVATSASVEDRYNEQDPTEVAAALVASADTLADLLDGLDASAWTRTGFYNYPERALRTVEWIAIHTVHELLHHRGDITSP